MHLEIEAEHGEGVEGTEKEVRHRFVAHISSLKARIEYQTNPRCQGEVDRLIVVSFEALQLKGESRYGLKAALSNGIPRARRPSGANGLNGCGVSRRFFPCFFMRCADERLYESERKTSKR